jgi:hypothetical protein
MISTIVSNLSELVALLVQSFNLSALFPSFAFALLNFLFVFPMLKDSVLSARFSTLSETVQVLVWGTFIVGTAYLLTALNNLIIRIFEGYPLIDQFPFNQRHAHHINRYSEIRTQIDELEKKIDTLEWKALMSPLTARPKIREQQGLLRAERNLLEGEKLFMYPSSRWRILPTRMGNVIAAAEDYPQQLFGIDTVLLWPFLVPILTEKGYSKFIEREKAVFDLLLNTTVLIALFGLELGYVEALTHGLTWRLVGELILLFGGAYALCALAARGAMGWGLTIRSAFVLHRHDLREALRLVSPNSYEKEVQMWEKVSRFYREPANASIRGKDLTLFDY